MSYRACIVTPWVGDGSTTDNAQRPQLGDDYKLAKWEDVTGQDAQNITPEPNEYCVVAEMEDAVLAAIESDPVYTVLWNEEIVEGRA